MTEWRQTTWGDLATLEYGKALRDYRGGTGPVQVFGTNGSVGWTSGEQSPGPGVIVGRKGAYRGVHYSSGPFWVIDTAYYLKPKNRLDLQWAYYALSNSDIDSMDSGSAIPSTSRSDFYTLPILVPPFFEQQAIGSVLGALDDKIAVNERAVQCVDRLMEHHYARAIELGGIKINTIADVADVFDGPHATPEKTTSGPWFLSISSLSRGRLALGESAHITEGDFEKWTRRITPQVGDLLFSYETRLGAAALMPPMVRGCLGRRMALLRPRYGTVGQRTLLQAFLSKSFQNTIRQRAVHGATVDRIPLTELPSWPIELPARGSESLEDLLRNLDTLASRNDRESGLLADLRDTLLPKLMSGELRVRDAEKVVEEAT